MFSSFVKNYKKNLTVLRIIMAITMAFVPSMVFVLYMASFTMGIDATAILCSILISAFMAMFALTDWAIAKLSTAFFLMMSACFLLIRPISEAHRILGIFFAVETIIYIYFKPLKRH